MKNRKAVSTCRPSKVSAPASGARLIGVQQAADQLGLSVWTIRFWAYNGKISSHKLGSKLMVSTAEIDRIVAESERPRVAA